MVQTKPLADEVTSVVQRQPEEEEEEEEELIQPKRESHTRGPISEGLDSDLQNLRGGGRPLDTETRGFMERRFGFDFSKVRIHADDRAADAAGLLRARAFTMGNNIVFNAGQYSPGTGRGRQLLAHELTHTIQQSSQRQSGSDVIMRTWDDAPGECTDVGDKWVERVVVEQEMPQSVTIHWSDGSIESGPCSTGKGHCCVDPSDPTGVACSVAGSRVSGSNCTPITEKKGYLIKNRYRKYNGWDYWCDFVTSRGIGLHWHHTVKGKPLSHGCVRQNMETARKIFCGARRNQTWVQVHGFARPMCNDPDLRAEWEKDFSYGGVDLTSGDGDSLVPRETVLSTRRMLNRAFGRTLTIDEIRGLTADDIPKCTAKAPKPTEEEARLIKPEFPKGSVPKRILASSGFDVFLTPFTTALANSYSLKTARKAVGLHGKKLWEAAVARAQGASPDTDDRPLYWARLQMSRALRQWQPKFALSASNHSALLTLLDQTSRGMTAVKFDVGESVKKILISGFDPFQLDIDIRKGNPAGAAALALDGKTLVSGGVTGHIESVVLPVSEPAFDLGMVESFFEPHMKGDQKADMIVAFGMGQSSKFEVEEYAGPPRSGAQKLAVTESPKKFHKTTLPTKELRSALGRTHALPGETGRQIYPGMTRIIGPAGAYLCNEIFYRLTLLRDKVDPTMPVGFIHTPYLAPPTGSGVSSSVYEGQRAAIIAKVEELIKAALPSL